MVPVRIELTCPILQTYPRRRRRYAHAAPQIEILAFPGRLLNRELTVPADAASCTGRPRGSVSKAGAAAGCPSHRPSACKASIPSATGQRGYCARVPGVELRASLTPQVQHPFGKPRPSAQARQWCRERRLRPPHGPPRGHRCAGSAIPSPSLRPVIPNPEQFGHLPPDLRQQGRMVHVRNACVAGTASPTHSTGSTWR